MIALRRWMLRLTFALFLLVGGWALLTVTAGPARADTGPGITAAGEALHGTVAVPPLPQDEVTRLPVEPSGQATTILSSAMTATTAMTTPTATGPLFRSLLPVGSGHEPSAAIATPSTTARTAVTAAHSEPPLAPRRPLPASGTAADAEREAAATPAAHGSPAPAGERAPAVTTRGESSGGCILTLPTPAGPATPTAPPPASRHAAAGGAAHPYFLAPAGSPVPVLACARAVLDVDRIGDDGAGISDPGSRPD